MDRLGTFTRLSHAQCLLHIVHAAGHGREGERPHPASP